MPINDHLNHVPDAAGVANIEQIRRHAIELEMVIDALVPDSREKSLAKTKLEECRMWAIKGAVMQYPVQELSQPVTHPDVTLHGPDCQEAGANPDPEPVTFGPR